MMSLAPPIALGATAEIYPWKDGQVLKLFNQGMSRGTVEYEARLTRIAQTTGLPVPAVGEIVEIGGRYGVEYEKIEGNNMLEALIQRPWHAPSYARQLARLQAEMHTHRVPEMPSQRERLAMKIKRARLPSDDLRQAALRALERLPEDDRLCHGDFHPGNILLTRQGPVIIDWIDATRGSSLLDVARSTILFGGSGPLPRGFPKAWLIRLIKPWFYHNYLRHYSQLNPLDPDLLKTWIPVVAAARLDENVAWDEQRLLSIAQAVLPER